MIVPNIHKLRAIVVGNDHYNTLNVIRQLGSDNFDVDAIIMNDNKSSFTLHSRYVKNGISIPSAQKLIKHLLENYRNQPIKIPLITTCDKIAILIDNHYDKLSEYFILPSIGMRQGDLSKFMDKNIQLAYAKNAGFDIPDSITVNLSSDDLSNIKFNKFPCLIKPESSVTGSKKDFRICNNQQELLYALDSLPQSIGNILVQQFIPNDQVIDILGVRTIQGDIFVLGEINKEKHGKKTHNLGLNAIGFWQKKSEIENNVRSFIEDINYYGLFSIEVIRSNIHPQSHNYSNFFLEANLRTDGLMYFYDKAGINFPSIWVKSAYGQPIDTPHPSKDIIYGTNEFLYISNMGIMQHPIATIRDFAKTDIFSTLSIVDPKPFFYRLIKHVKK